VSGGFVSRWFAPSPFGLLGAPVKVDLGDGVPDELIAAETSARHTG
jgi:hypothetical protein